MKKMLIMALCSLLILALAPCTALAGLLEAEPTQITQPSEIPAIVPEPTVVPTTWSMPKTFRATKGGTYQLVEVHPDDHTLPTIYALSSKPDIVSVNDRGEITAKDIGKVTITVKAQSGKLIKCGVEVVRNQVSRKKAAKGEPGEVATSTKSLAYDGGKLKIEVYVLNRTGRTIKNAKGLKLQLKQGESVLFEKALPTWKIKKGLKSGAQKVYKLSLSKKELAEFTGDVLDLGSGEYEAIIMGWDGEAAVSAASSASAASAAVPAEGPELAEVEPVNAD